MTRLGFLRLLGMTTMARYGSLGQMHRRPDQQTDAPPSAVAPTQAAGILRARAVIIFGTGASAGLFVYNGTPALGNPPQVAIVPTGVTKDPFGNAIGTSKILIQGNIITESGGVFRTAGTSPLIQLDGPHNAYLEYASGITLSESIAPSPTTDGLGNTVQQGFTSYGTGVFGQLTGANLAFTATGDALFALVNGSGGTLQLQSGHHAGGTVQSYLRLVDSGGATSTAAAVLSTGVSAPVQATTALLEVQGSLALANVAAPASVAGNAIAFASGSQLRVIDGADANSYTTERLAKVITAGQTINSTTSAIISAGGVSLSFPMSASRTYRFNAHVSWLQGVTQSQQFFRLIGTGGLTATALLVSVSQRTQSTTGQNVFDGDLVTLNTDTSNFGASGPAGGTTNTADFYGIITVNAAGTLNLEARCSNAANTYSILAGSWAEIMPV